MILALEIDMKLTGIFRPFTSIASSLHLKLYSLESYIHDSLPLDKKI